MDLGQRKLLVDKTNVGLFRQQPLDGGMGLLAARTLQVREFDDGEGRILRAARRTSRASRQLSFDSPRDESYCCKVPHRKDSCVHRGRKIQCGGA